MRDKRTYSVYPSNLNILDAFKKVRQYFNDNGYIEDDKICDNIKHVLKPGKDRSLETKKYDEFLLLLDKYPLSLPIIVHSHWRKEGKDVACIINISSSNIDTLVESDDIDRITVIHEAIKEIFEANNPIAEDMRKRSRFDVKKSVFIAHRFDDEGNTIANELKKFLSRLGFDVLEGSGYEASDIPDKVSRKIESQDIFICIVTPGDNTWIISEAGYAKALKKYIVVLSEEGSEFNKGIIGADYEYISFPKDNITNIYSELLYALPV